jgi:hypothetical protein
MFPPRREYGVMDLWELSFSSDWNKGGWIVEREKINLLCRVNHNNGLWSAYIYRFGDGGQHIISHEGKTPLVAAMRCYVASKLGKTVEIPDELTMLGG